VKIARDAPRLLGFAIYVWTILAKVVQIYIAISATEASGQVPQAEGQSPLIRREVRSVFKNE
jgi:hypothetical protein